MGKFTFRKEERLSKEKHIQELFDKGSSFYLFPFKVLFMPNADPALSHHQVLISVSKKNFKRAVDRNLIKRRIREVYRLQKEFLPAAPPLQIGYIYTHKEILPFDEMKRRMLLSFKKLPKSSTQTTDTITP
jgi:ribonuclease P protein component